MKPIYFDLSVRDIGRARAFFETLFGWRFEKFPMPYEYYRIRAGSEDEFGIDGGMGAVNASSPVGYEPMTQITVLVPNLDEALQKATSCGGRIVEPRMRIPGIGWYASCAEPGGLTFGMLQAAVDAAAPP